MRELSCKGGNLTLLPVKHAPFLFSCQWCRLRRDARAALESDDCELALDVLERAGLSDAEHKGAA